MKNYIVPALIFFICISQGISQAKQNEPSGAAESLLQSAQITGNVQSDAQYYMKDSKIGTKDVPEKMGSNNYFYMAYAMGGFTAGLRYEAYLNPLLGYEGFSGYGIANRFVSYNSDFISVTAGNFYEQFGSGVILRTYEERQLGYDNSIDGFRIKIHPLNGLNFTGLIGKERKFWSYGKGIVRGFDANASVFELFDSKTPFNLNVGASVVSKYQEDNNPNQYIPQNVLAHSERVNLSGEHFNLDAEFGYKYNDPNAASGFNYNPGTALILSGAVFGNGYGFTLGIHRYDNMEYRTENTAKLNEVLINYLPTLTKQHVYALTSIYPYGTQVNGEVGMQAEFTYTFPKEWFDGKNPMNLIINYSRIQNLDTSNGNGFTYQSNLKPGKALYYQDINFELVKRWSRTIDTKYSMIYLTDDRRITEGESDLGIVDALINAVEFQYKFAANKSLRMELQHLNAWERFDLKVADQTNGNWAMFLAEFTVAPHWYVSAMDMWNYGNHFEESRLHYLNAGVAYIHEGTRVSFSYGRQRKGILCVGGVCRQVEASNGLNLSVTTSF